VLKNMAGSMCVPDLSIHMLYTIVSTGLHNSRDGNLEPGSCAGSLPTQLLAVWPPALCSPCLLGAQCPCMYVLHSLHCGLVGWHGKKNGCVGRMHCLACLLCSLTPQSHHTTVQ
jgi:hypothetical protein